MLRHETNDNDLNGNKSTLIYFNVEYCSRFKIYFVVNQMLISAHDNLLDQDNIISRFGLIALA